MLIFTYYDDLVRNTFMKSMQSIGLYVPNSSSASLVILSNAVLSAKEISQLNSIFATVSVVKPLRDSEIDKVTNLQANTKFVEVLLSYSDYERLYVDPTMILMNSFVIPATTSLFFRQHKGQLSTKLVYLKPGNQFNTAFTAIHKGKWITSITDMEFTYVVHNNYLIQKSINPKSILNGKAFVDSTLDPQSISDQAAIDASNVDLTSGKMQKLLDRILPTSKAKSISKILKKPASSELVPFPTLVHKSVAPVSQPEPIKPPKIKKNIVFELPFYDTTSGGINRSLRIVMELPHYSKTCGGIRDNIFIAGEFEPIMELRFQTLVHGKPPASIGKWSVGLPDETFPECDICITYSDNPHVEKLVNLPQVRKVFILMLSYGMNLPVERANVLNPKVTVLCSSKKLETAIEAEGVKVHRLGLGLDMSKMYLDPKVKRKKYLAILYNSMLTKKYETAVEVANELYDNGKIDGVITFGRYDRYDSFSKPKGLVKHYSEASPDQVREIFNLSQCFLMPSSTEGLNLTPIESTLCGCPAVLCDGAIGEVFFDKKNCFIVPVEDKVAMVDACSTILNEFSKYSEPFRREMEKITQTMTWPHVLDNLTKVIIELDPKQVVIIPVHNQLDYVKACVKTVIDKTKNPTIILVDDGSTDDSVQKWASDQSYLTYIRHPKALGFSAACNSGIEYAIRNLNFDVLCLLNSDTEIVTPDWFTKIENSMRSNDLAIAGPVSNSAICQTVNSPDIYLQNIETKPVIENPLVHGFCYFIRKDVILKIGMLDGLLFPHYGSEDDYSLRAIKFGFKNGVVSSVFVRHHGETSYSNSGRAQLLRTSIPNLVNRWGRDYVNQCVAKANEVNKKINSSI